MEFHPLSLLISPVPPAPIPLQRSAGPSRESDPYVPISKSDFSLIYLSWLVMLALLLFFFPIRKYHCFICFPNFWWTAPLDMRPVLLCAVARRSVCLCSLTTCPLCLLYRRPTSCRRLGMPLWYKCSLLHTTCTHSCTCSLTPSLAHTHTHLHTISHICDSVCMYALMFM